MKKHFNIQIAVIAAGTIFSWFTVVQDFVRFFGFEGTVFKVQDCIVPNPITTPCFWGAMAFLVALIWSIKISRVVDDVRRRMHQKYLVWFLVAGTIFGWSNMALLFQRFIVSQGKPAIGCSGLLMTNPFNTPCFYGSMLFLLSLLVALSINVKLKKIVLKQ